MITSPEEFRQRLLDIQNSVDVVYTTLPSDEPRFIIDANSRTITIPVEFQFLGVKNDHNAETIYFEIDRYFDDEDLSQHTCVVQFSNKNNSNDGGVYPVTTMDTTSVHGKIIFGWEIKSDATSLVGDIYFSVRFYSINSTDYVFTYNFNTLTAKSVILDTLDVDNQMIIENYPSELDAWLDRMNELEAGTSGKVEEIEAKGQEVLTEINSVKVSIPEDYSTLSSDVSELKNDLTDLDEILNVKHLRKVNVTTTGSYVRAIAFSGLSLIGGHSYTFTVKPVSVTTNEYYLYFVDASGAETTINDRTDRITYNFTPTEDMNNVSIKVSSGASSEQTFECSWIENVGDNEIVTVNKKIDDLFDGTDLVELSILNGHFVTGASGYEGTISGDNYSCVTSLIPVRPNDKLRIDNVYLDSNRSICAYDEEGNFVEVIAKDKTDKVTSYTFTVPENCYYIRATGKTGVAPTVTFLSIPNNLDSLRVENPIATITNGYYITRYSGLEGAVSDASDSAVTDYIPVKPNSVINIDGIYNENNRCTCCYDKNKKFVSVLSSSITRMNFSKNIKIPSNARYIRITSHKDVVPTIKYVNTIIDGSNVSNPYVSGKELFDSSTLKPVLTFIDDDTWGIQYVTRQKELCDRLGIKCSFACLTEQVEKNEGLLELLLSYELEGFPIIFHANQQINEYDTSTLDVVAEERDFVTGLQKMHKFGFSDYKIWCTPFGSSREDQKKLAYKWGFDGLVTSGYVKAYNNPYEYSSRFEIKRNSLGSNTDTTASDIVDDVANIKLAIDNASECNGWVCISTHSAYNLYLNGEADDAMEEIVNYAISKGFEIRTVNEELRRRMPIYRYYEQF